MVTDYEVKQATICYSTLFEGMPQVSKESDGSRIFLKEREKDVLRTRWGSFQDMDTYGSSII